VTGYLFALSGAVLTLVLMFELLRRRRLREKYAALWISISVVVIVCGAFPRLLFWAADLVGITTPVNLLFFLSLLVLLIVCVQLSAEISSLEHEAQTLAEESALLRLRVERLETRTGMASPQPAVADPEPHRATS
jgi:hypothetical protein